MLALALEDFVPVVLSGAGLWILSQRSTAIDVGAGFAVQAGLTLIVVGGLTKPVYKLILAVSGGSVDVAILDSMLFWFLAPGFLLVAGGLASAARSPHSVRSRTVVRRATALASVTVAAAAGLLVSAPDSRFWFFLLLLFATVGNTWMIVVLVRWSRDVADPVAGRLFIANLVIVFGLAGSASAFEQTIPVQWGEQLASTVAQGFFLLAAVRLSRRLQVSGVSADAVVR